MGKALYSASHDKNNQPPRKPKAAKKPPRTASVPQEEALKFAPGLIQPTDEQRRQIRASQLKKAHLQETDLDLLDVEMLGRPSSHTEDGFELFQTTGPQQAGPRPWQRKPHHMEDVDFEEIENDPDLQRRAALVDMPDAKDIETAPEENAPQSLLDTPELRSMDQGVQRLFDAARNLVIAAKAVQAKLGTEDQEIQHHIDSIVDITDTAIGDWVRELDDHFGSLVEAIQKKS